MPTITLAQIRACYDAAREVRASAIGATIAARQVSDATGMTYGSALDYVYNVNYLVAGQSYTRTMNPEATRSILDWIAQDVSADHARIAAQRVLDHVAYYSKLPRSGPQHAVRAVAEAVLGQPLIAPAPTLAAHLARETAALAAALARSPNERHARLADADPMPKTSTVTTTVFLRNMDVVAEVLHRAKGTCEGCAKPAPFARRTDGTPYLEVHHRLPLAQNGPDTAQNALALCPNCHRRAHHGPP